MKLTKEQIELGAKWIAVADTGYMQKAPTTKGDIEMAYSERSYEYECEFGVGLIDERIMWEKELSKKNNNSSVEILKKEVPFIFENSL